MLIEERLKELKDKINEKVPRGISVTQVEFEGPALPLPEIRPTEATILEDEAGLALLSGYMIRASCKSFEQTTLDGKTLLDMRFKH